ncbi:MAG: hypothetical protein Tsb006_5040 [Rickettsiaceae bacterium]
MELKIVANNLGRVTRQRNLFLLLVVMVVIANLLLVLTLATTKEKIVMVPGIGQEMSITGNNVSESYLEEVALLFLSGLLDLSPDTVDHKRDLVLKYTAHSGAGHIEKIKEYFALAKEEHEKFKLSTYFTVKNMTIDNKKLEVLASGVLNSSFGMKGFASKHLSYLLKFELVAGHLRLRAFNEVIADKKTDKK